jgi:hypothetical protein
MTWVYARDGKVLTEWEVPVAALASDRRFITSVDESDAWLIYATPNSLGSEPCKEEIAYALDRALSQRGQGFPVIGLFAGPSNFGLFPAALRTRLCVNMEDPDWKDRIRERSCGCPARTVANRLTRFSSRPSSLRTDSLRRCVLARAFGWKDLWPSPRPRRTCLTWFT